MRDVLSVLHDWEDGTLTIIELRHALIHAAVSQPPEELVEHLGSEHLAIVRQAVANPPLAPEDIRIIRGGSFLGPAQSYEDADRKDQAAYFQGVRTWHAYFQRVDGSGEV